MIFTLLLTVLVLVAGLLMIVVLLQAGTGGGLAAMGGGAASESFIGGRQATTILTKASWWLGGIFLGLSLILSGLSTTEARPRSVLEEEPPLTAPTPVAPPALPLELQTPPSQEQGRQPSPENQE